MWNKQYNYEERYNKALEDIRSEGVLVFDNYPMCCGSCASWEISDKVSDDDEYIFFTNQQGGGLTWQRGLPYNFEFEYPEDWDEDEEIPESEHEEKLEKSIIRIAKSLSWKHRGDNAARIVVEVFTKHGFKVDWDGSDTRCPVVDLLFDEEARKKRNAERDERISQMEQASVNTSATPQKRFAEAEESLESMGIHFASDVDESLYQYGSVKETYMSNFGYMDEEREFVLFVKDPAGKFIWKGGEPFYSFVRYAQPEVRTPIVIPDEESNVLDIMTSSGILGTVKRVKAPLVKEVEYEQPKPVFARTPVEKLELVCSDKDMAEFATRVFRSKGFKVEWDKNSELDPVLHFG